ncbi:hypothetical protein C8J57DRAFT_1522747 [Mycena rebaudengoi]|nr:hypothetical protein C8J57DRAFT_1522747 [Mycena rebaudengoi]
MSRACHLRCRADPKSFHSELLAAVSSAPGLHPRVALARGSRGFIQLAAESASSPMGASPPGKYVLTYMSNLMAPLLARLGRSASYCTGPAQTPHLAHPRHCHLDTWYFLWPPRRPIQSSRICRVVTFIRRVFPPRCGASLTLPGRLTASRRLLARTSLSARAPVLIRSSPPGRRLLRTSLTHTLHRAAAVHLRPRIQPPARTRQAPPVSRTFHRALSIQLHAAPSSPLSAVILQLQPRPPAPARPAPRPRLRAMHPRSSTRPAADRGAAPSFRSSAAIIVQRHYSITHLGCAFPSPPACTPFFALDVGYVVALLYCPPGQHVPAPGCAPPSPSLSSIELTLRAYPRNGSLRSQSRWALMNGYGWALGTCRARSQWEQEQEETEIRRQTTRVQATTTTPTTSTFPGIRAHAKESGTGAAQRMRPHRADNAVALHPHIRSRGQCVLSSSSPASFQAVASSLRGEDSGGRDGREGRTSAFDESACTHVDAYMPPPVVFALASVDFAHARASKPVLRCFGGKGGTGVAQRMRYHCADEPSRPARTFGNADDAYASTHIYAHARAANSGLRAGKSETRRARRTWRRSWRHLSCGRRRPR